MSASPTVWPSASSSSTLLAAKLFSTQALRRSIRYDSTESKRHRTTRHYDDNVNKSRARRRSSCQPEELCSGFAETLSQATRRWCQQQRVLMTAIPLQPAVVTRRASSYRPPLIPRRLCSTDRHHQQSASSDLKLTRGEMRGLLDYYSSEQEESAIDAHDGNNQSADVLVQPQPTPKQEEKDIQRIVRRLEDALRNLRSTPDDLAAIYNTLPPPGAAHVSERTLDALCRRFARVPYKSHPTMLRFLQLVTDMRSAGRHVSVDSWTSAIAFAGRCVKRITASEIESALSLWKQMESQAGIRANEVTFNVLFDVASKAGKFVLAEMLLREMKVRGHQFNRYMRVNLMYYYGLRGDGAGVRRSYKELVEAGEIVDTAVMSCAVASLLKAGEPVAAEQVFERAKRLHAAKGGKLPLPPHQWQKRRELGRSLLKAAVRLRDATPEERKQVQDMVPLAPGVHAYKVLVYYYAVQAGDIERVSALVDEMAWYQIPVQGAIFLHLFKGFAVHGGVLYSAWTRERLETTFQAFLDAVEDAKGETASDTSSHPSEDTTIANDLNQQHLSSGTYDSKTVGVKQQSKALHSRDHHDPPTSSSTTHTPISFSSNFGQHHPADRTHISRAACFLCLSAYMRVVDATRAGEVWAQLQLLWMPTPSDREAVETYLVELEERKRRWEMFGPRIGRARNSGMARWLR